MNLQLKKLTATDRESFEALIQVFEKVFEMKGFTMPPSRHLEKLLNQEDFIVLTAWSGDEVIGGLTAYKLHQYYSTAPLIYIYDLAVATDYQRQGIGKQLIAELHAYGKGSRAEEIFVQADGEDSHALDFYRSTGAVEKKVSHFLYFPHSHEI